MTKQGRDLWLLVLSGIVFTISIAMLWIFIFIYNDNRKNAVFQSWTNMELQIVREAAAITQKWIEERHLVGNAPLDQVEQEVFSLYIDPIKLLSTGNAWIYNSKYVVFNNSSDFPAGYEGKTIQQIFELQKQDGASHFEDIVNGVMNSSEGVGWYIWLPNIGKEYAAWTSVRVLDDSWTIGLATPESEVLDFYNLTNEYSQNVRWAATFTTMLLAIYVLIFRQYRRNVLYMHTLEKAVAERTEQLQRSEERYRQLVEQITAVTYIDAVDHYSSSIFMSPQIVNITGYTADEWKEKPDLWLNIIYPEDKEKVSQENERTNKTGEPFSMDYRMISKDGRVIWVHDEAVLTRSDGNTSWHGVLYEITERKHMEETLRYLGNHDALTGVYNRTYFEEEIRRLQRSRRYPISLIVGDIDNLKSVNDRYGHVVGDKLIRSAARIFESVFRGGDVVARTGGDEFVIILPETNKAAAELALDRLRAAVSKKGKTEPVLSISFGMATGEQGASLTRLLKTADDNMYKEKQLKKKALKK